MLLITVAGVVFQEPPSAAKSLVTAQSIALTLRLDAAEVLAETGRGTGGAGLTSRQRTKILNDISAAWDAHRELWQMDEVASPSQDAVIIRIAPLLIDLIQNTEKMLDHSQDHEPGDLAGRGAVANQLASQIIDVIDKCRDCGVRQPGS